MPLYRPWTNRRFGIELEMNNQSRQGVQLSHANIRDAVRRGVSAAGIPDGGLGQARRVRSTNDGYYHSNGDTWDIKTDRSCAGPSGGTGWEIASPALMLDDEGECVELREVMREAAALNPRIDRTCGMHVHVEVADFDWQDLQRLIILWARYEPFFYELCPPSRATNTRYCAPFRRSTWNGSNSTHWSGVQTLINASTRRAAQTASVNTPRGSMNLAHFWHNQRVEFRLAGGTMEYEKAVRWVQLMLTLVARVKLSSAPRILPGEYLNQPVPVDFMARMLGLRPAAGVVSPEDVPEASGKLVTWMRARYQQFQPGSALNALDAAILAGVRADGGQSIGVSTGRLGTSGGRVRVMGGRYRGWSGELQPRFSDRDTCVVHLPSRDGTTFTAVRVRPVNLMRV